MKRAEKMKEGFHHRKDFSARERKREEKKEVEGISKNVSTKAMDDNCLQRLNFKKIKNKEIWIKILFFKTKLDFKPFTF